MSEEVVVIDGITLAAASADGHGWTYLPNQPAIERSANGAPMFSIIEAGPVAFLQCTARLALNDAARAQLLARLKAVRPEAETLESARITVTRIALEVSSGDVWETVAESSGSGMPPWTAALAATLAPAPLAAIKAAAGGESGRARLRASIMPPASPVAYRRAEAAGTYTTRVARWRFRCELHDHDRGFPDYERRGSARAHHGFSIELAPGAVGTAEEGAVGRPPRGD